MKTKLTLQESVNNRINSIAKQTDLNFSPAVLEAMRLADVYESVKSQEHILPLDTLAGFVVTSRHDN